MKYFSIDIETTGIDSDLNQILQIGIVLEDTNNLLPIEDLPKFMCYVDNGDTLCGSPFALSMNSKILQRLADPEYLEESDKVYPVDIVSSAIKIWINHVYPECPTSYCKLNLVCAGKNFGSFDKLFLQKLPRWNNFFKISHRSIDPAGYAIDWVNDTDLPDSKLCLSRANIEKSVSHDALEDALDIIKILRKFTNNYSLKLY